MRLAHELEAWEGQPAAHWQSEWQLPDLRFLSVTASTNDDIRQLAEAGAATGTTVIAELQTAGRGRRGRHWHGEPGRSLHLSMLVRAPVEGFDTPGAAAVRVGLLSAEALRREVPLDVVLKWPNDLQAGNAKVGGILCESVLGSSPFLVIGIGINVAQADDDFPPDLRVLATSLAHASGVAVSRARVAGAIARALQASAASITDPLAPAELERIAALDSLRGRTVEIDGAPAGQAVGVNAEGALLVDDGGAVRPVLSGTVRIASTIS